MTWRHLSTTTSLLDNTVGGGRMIVASYRDFQKTHIHVSQEARKSFQKPK